MSELITYSFRMLWCKKRVGSTHNCCNRNPPAHGYGVKKRFVQFIGFVQQISLFSHIAQYSRSNLPDIWEINVSQNCSSPVWIHLPVGWQLPQGSSDFLSKGKMCNHRMAGIGMFSCLGRVLECPFCNAHIISGQNDFESFWLVLSSLSPSFLSKIRLSRLKYFLNVILSNIDKLLRYLCNRKFPGKLV